MYGVATAAEGSVVRKKTAPVVPITPDRGVIGVIPIPTPVLVTASLFVRTVRSPVMVAEARVAVPPAPRIWLTVTFLVVPLAAMLVSSRSTIGIGKVAGLTGLVEIAVKAVIFVSAISVNG